MKNFVLLDDAEHHRCRLYRAFSHRCSGPSLATLDAELAAGWRAGLHAVLLMPYAADAQAFQLSWFAQLDFLDDAEAWLATQSDDEAAGIGPLHWPLSPAAYAQKIAAIHEAIRAGKSYQVNFTTTVDFETYGDPIALYRRLRRAQATAFSALYRADHHWLLSLSPECFLSRKGDTVVTRPMKGTAPIVGDGRDAQRRQELAEDAKNRAENAMIVDLMRNDLGQVARLGSVQVQNPFAVMACGKVWQMTSEVCAQYTGGWGALLAALFPCGSITGAPKGETMRIIAELETAPRGYYTGTLGYLEPEGGALSVLIRTLALDEENKRGTMGVGSGITIASTAESEYAECQWKSQFLRSPPALSLIETMAVDATGAIPLLERHLARMHAGALFFGIPWCERRARETLARAQKPAHRLRLLLEPEGVFTATATPLLPRQGLQTLMIAPEVLPLRDPRRRYKTTARAPFNRAIAAAERAGAFDALLFNTRGELLEGGRSTVYLKLDGQWWTPPRSLDLLEGVMRAEVLATQNYLGCVRERVMTRAELHRAEALAVSNALHGVLPARLHSSCALRSP